MSYNVSSFNFCMIRLKRGSRSKLNVSRDALPPLIKNAKIYGAAGKTSAFSTAISVILRAFHDYCFPTRRVSQMKEQKSELDLRKPDWVMESGWLWIDWWRGLNVSVCGAGIWRVRCSLGSQDGKVSPKLLTSLSRLSLHYCYLPL